jgi:aspartyl protease family protein
MGVEDRDWLKDAQRQREATGSSPRFSKAIRGVEASREGTGGGGSLPRGLRWGPLGIVLFWLVLMGAVYGGIQQVMKPRQVTVSVAGDITIPRARDGHFYVTGLVANQPVVFLVDTGASLVTVSQAFADAAGLGPGQPTRFNTANGTIEGHIVPNVPVSIGGASVSGVKVAVGLVGTGPDKALLGQSFLSKFRITLTRDAMLLQAADRH